MFSIRQPILSLSLGLLDRNIQVKLVIIMFGNSDDFVEKRFSALQYLTSVEGILRLLSIVRTIVDHNSCTALLNSNFTLYPGCNPPLQFPPLLLFHLWRCASLVPISPPRRLRCLRIDLPPVLPLLHHRNCWEPLSTLECNGYHLQHFEHCDPVGSVHSHSGQLQRSSAESR